MSLKTKLLFWVMAMLTCMALSVWVGKIYFQAKWAENNSGLMAEKHIKGDKGFPGIGGPFKLVDHEGHIRTDADFKGKIMLVYFGYTFCPDICPAALINMTEALTKMGKKASQIQPIFITIDPLRDTSPHLKIYMENYHPSFIALTGDMPHIEIAKKAYRVYGAKAKPDDSTTDYIMDHSSIIYVMDRQGRFITHLNHTTLPEEMIRILEQVID